MGLGVQLPEKGPLDLEHKFGRGFYKVLYDRVIVLVDLSEERRAG